ncbi:MAG TPA: hypothetical protein EYO08_05565 [Candidatus Marinimicrobia bacterium]|nr:hypothetical protein [Candidatus Neomarinimicrobiota bacterium]
MTVVSVTAPKEEALEPDIPVEEDLELEGEEGEEGEVAEGEETPAEGEEGAEESKGDKKEEGTSE